MKKSTVLLASLLFAVNMASAAPKKNAAAPVVEAEEPADAVPEKLPRGYITSGVLIWSPVSDAAVTLAEAKKTCESSTALGKKWRLPTKDELVEFHVDYRHTLEKLRAEGWTLSEVWSSTPGTTVGIQFVVNLDRGLVTYADETNGLSNVTCVS